MTFYRELFQHRPRLKVLSTKCKIHYSCFQFLKIDIGKVIATRVTKLHNLQSIMVRRRSRPTSSNRTNLVGFSTTTWDYWVQTRRGTRLLHVLSLFLCDQVSCRREKEVKSLLTLNSRPLPNFYTQIRKGTGFRSYTMCHKSNTWYRIFFLKMSKELV